MVTRVSAKNQTASPAKLSHSGLKIIEISAYIAAGIFNDSFTSILRIMNALDISSALTAKFFPKILTSRASQDKTGLSLSKTKEA